MSNNLTLNAKKFQFKQPQVSYYGHCWSKEGISPDPKKIEALNHMEFPPDKETMRSFLGKVNYLNRYSESCAHLCTPLSALTHQAKDYKPTKEHFDKFNELKDGGSSIMSMHQQPSRWMLPRKDLEHASYRRIVICFASHSLTKTEQNYQNLEREALGTTWGMEKFHYFLYGKEFTLETNQKPLVSSARSIRLTLVQRYKDS